MSQPLGKSEIIKHLAALDRALVVRDLRAQVVVVGGSYLALLDLRAATVDIDTVTQLTDDLRAAIEDVAAQADLDGHWLNDSARAFAPRWTSTWMTAPSSSPAIGSWPSAHRCHTCL